MCSPNLVAKAVYTLRISTVTSEQLTTITNISVITDTLIIVVQFLTPALDTRSCVALVDPRFAVGARKSGRARAGIATEDRRTCTLVAGR